MKSVVGLLFICLLKNIYKIIIFKYKKPARPIDDSLYVNKEY